ncbi:MAG: hypothetical protein LBV18_07335 [Alistipes sp.]|jgi:cell division septal protein FtsQ|nr:hypothetical protein [Alistipes sp.]
MSWRLTAEERRIIERTKREGEELHASLPPESPVKRREQMVRSIAALVGAMIFFALLWMLFVWLGSLM